LVLIRPIEERDAETCGRIGYEAHKAVSSTHGYPSEQPTEEYGIGLVKTLLGNPNSWGAVAENRETGKVLGSIFLHKFPPSPVAVVGPLTVHPSAEGGVGKALMDAALGQARKQGREQVRLVQSPSHIRSFVLYTKSGFVLREPLLLIQGKPMTHEDRSNGDAHHVQTDGDISACGELCKEIHGFSREGELRQAIGQGAAMMIEKNGQILGYSAGIGLFGHAVAKSNKVLKALIESATAILGPGFFVPARNHELLKWLLENGFKIAWPANLMTLGAYRDPSGPILPSIAY
jgi:predicted N-acetyltransferase YhbS